MIENVNIFHALTKNTGVKVYKYTLTYNGNEIWGFFENLKHWYNIVNLQFSSNGKIKLCRNDWKIIKKFLKQAFKNL